MIEETEIAHVWWDARTDGGGSSYGLGTNAKRIVLTADGHGLSGFYDRIHVWTVNGNHLVFPAHNVDGWRLKDVDPDDETLF